MEQSKMLSFSNRIYSLLLRAYPAPFRREYGRDMTQVFRDDMRGTLRESGAGALFGLWFIILIDLFKTAFAEHIWEVFHMPVEKMTRWSGPAAAIGGILFSFGVIWIFGITRSVTSMALIVLLFLGTLPFLCLGLYGLYKGQSQFTGWRNGLLLGLSLFGLTLSNISTTVMILLNRDELLFVGSAGYLLYIIGLGGMGLVSLRTQSLGKWSFAPMMISVMSLLGLLLLFLSAYEITPLMIIWEILVGLGWLFLGIGLLQNQGDQAGPAMLA